MPDINQIVSLGIGGPGDIEHFILVGLNGTDSGVPVVPGIIIVAFDDVTTILADGE